MHPDPGIFLKRSQNMLKAKESQAQKMGKRQKEAGERGLLGVASKMPQPFCARVQIVMETGNLNNT
jgi:hypothetical protein